MVFIFILPFITGYCIHSYHLYCATSTEFEIEEETKAVQVLFYFIFVLHLGNVNALFSKMVSTLY